MSMNRERVLITGASAGIGAALARRYAGRGARVLLVARRADRLQALAAELSGLVCSGDIADPATSAAAVALAQQEWGGLDVIVANAGFAVAGNVEALACEDYRRQFATNVLGVVALVQAALPALRASRGRIAIVGSVAGTVPMPGTSAYGMSKAALRPFAEALRMELAGCGVSVTLLTPGLVVSDIRRTDNHGIFDPAAVDRVPASLAMPTDAAAKRMVRAIDRRRREVVITWHGWFLLLLWRTMPWLMRPILARARSWNSAASERASGS